MFSTPETSILVHVAGHQVEVPRLDLGITSRLVDISSELPMITRVSRVDDASCYTSSSEPAEVNKKGPIPWRKNGPKPDKSIAQSYETTLSSNLQLNQYSNIIQSQNPKNNTTMPPTDGSNASSSNGRLDTPPSHYYGATMPHPGQPGAMQFNGENVTKFLDEWNIECEDFDLDDAKRCTCFPNYCTREIKETVKLLPGYIAKNWATLQSDVKKLYWSQDKPKNTMATLNKLIKEAPRMDLNVYVLKYTSILEALVAAHSLLALDRVA